MILIFEHYLIVSNNSYNPNKTTNTNNLVLNFDDKEVANLPLSSLSTQAPLYDPKWKKSTIPKKVPVKKNYQSLKIFE